MDPIWATTSCSERCQYGGREAKLTGLRDDLDECFDEPALLLSREHHLGENPRTRPPIRSRPSSIVTVTPFLVSTSAALKPAMPAPTTQTCGIRPWGRVLRIISSKGAIWSPKPEMRLADVAELDFLLLLVLLLRLTGDMLASSCLLRAAA